MPSFLTPTRFQFLDEKLNFCSRIAEIANMAESAEYRRNIFTKNFRRYWAAVYRLYVIVNIKTLEIIEKANATNQRAEFNLI